MTRGSKSTLPSFLELAWPTLQVLVAADGPVTSLEIEERVASTLGLTSAAREVKHGSSGRSELRYRLGWARTQLKAVGAARPVSRGAWQATSHGRRLSREQLQQAANASRTQDRSRQGAAG